MNQILNSEDSEKIKSVIRELFSALCADYGNLFESQFRGMDDHGYTPDKWKYRLYKRVYGCSERAIVEGYDNLVNQLAGSRMPTMDDIVTAIKYRNRQLIEEKPKNNNPALQFSGGIPGYIDALGNANIGNPVAEKAIKEIREILNR